MKKIYTSALFFLAFTLMANAQSLLIDTKPDKIVQEGEVFSIDVTVNDFEEVVSCQFAVFWDPQVLQYIGVNNHSLPEVNSDNLSAMNADEGKFRFSWYDPSTNVEGVTLADGSAIFSVQFKAIGGPAMSSIIEVGQDTAHPIFYLEFVNADSEQFEVNFNFGQVTIDGINSSRETITQDFTLFQNNPNPFTTTTNLSFSLNQRSQAQLSIHDHAGKLIFEQNENYSAGLHTIQIDRNLFSSAGSYFFTLKTENATATRQLVVQ
ncbi:MAG: T9SS type A sorting domain-containing protein [Bacteroidota bacterium]